MTRSIAVATPGAHEPRGLSEWMLDQFAEADGLLQQVLVVVRNDPQLDLQIRKHYVNIYYRGSSLMEIRQPARTGKRLTTRFDKRYLPEFAKRPWPATAEEEQAHEWLKAHDVLGLLDLADAADVRRHLASFPYRKAAIGAWLERRPKLERQAQQEIVRLNNAAAGGEYLICDIEYAFKYWDTESKRHTGRVDMVAAYRPRPEVPGAAAQLAFIELKYGVSAIDGAAGLQKHVTDLHGLLGRGDLQHRAEEMVGLVEQKRALGLISAAAPTFDLTAPLVYVIAGASHNDRSQRLLDALLGSEGRGESRLAWPEGVDARVTILGDDMTLRHDCMVACDDITEDRVPPEIFCGRKLRDRSPRATRPAQAAH